MVCVYTGSSVSVQSEVQLAAAMVPPSQQHPLWSHKKRAKYFDQQHEMYRIRLQHSGVIHSGVNHTIL